MKLSWKLVVISWLCAFAPPAQADERWVVIGGDVAAIVAELNGDAPLVGRDDTSLYPPSVAELPSVGYLRQLSAESVMSLSPTRILTNQYAGPEEVLEQLETVGLSLDIISSPHELNAIAGKVRDVAERLDRPEAGETLANQLEDQLATLNDKPALPTTQAAFVLSHSGVTPRMAGQDTGAHTMLEAVGLHNAFDSMQGYQAVGAEALARQAPEIIIASQQGLEAIGGEEALWALPGMALTPAAKHQRLVLVDGQALLGFGPRAPQQLLELRATLDTLLSSDETSLP
ncbi:MAG: ABC transporter substrate-binding protein [Halomonas sp.]|nr:ABC transporter substrate-binding protein [Halomonas sp.]TVM06579.1 MAG: ABC transporter substrate-binding protein [Halomonas sp.]